MRKRNRCRAGAVLLSLALLAGMTGCSKKTGNTGGQPEPAEGAKGRYVETAMELPEGVHAADIVQIGKKDGKLVFLVEQKTTGEASTFAEYVQEENGFQMVEDSWCKSLVLPADCWKFSSGYGPDGRVFVYTQFEDEEGYIGHLYVAKAGEEVVEITPESFKTKQEYDGYAYYDYPFCVGFADADTLVGVFYDRMEFYRADTGEMIRKQPLSGTYAEQMATGSDGFYLLTSTDGGSFNGVEKYQPGQSEPVETLAFNEKADYSVFCDVSDDGTITVAVRGGFYQWKEETQTWELLIPAGFTSLAMETMWCRNLVVTGDGMLYALFSGQEESDAALMQYVYDPDLQVTPEKVLTVYTINECPVLKQAAALFQKRHPEVQVQVETELTYEQMYSDDVDRNSIYAALNAKIMAGEAADILVLDGMDLNALAEKGVLLNLDDVVTPLEESGELLTNITGGYRQGDGTRYVVPLRFGLTLLVGRDVDANQVSDMESLAKVLSSASGSVLGERTVEDLAAEFVPFFTDEIVKNKELDKAALTHYLKLLKVIGTNCGIVKDYGEDFRSPGIWEIASSVQAAFYETDGFNQAMLPVSAAKLVNGTVSCFANAFTPKVQAAVYSQTKEPELAKEFLEFALSPEVQKNDFYDGFPVNVSALEEQAQRDRSDAEAYTTIVIGDGSSSAFEIRDFDEDQAKKLLAMCRQADRKVVADKEVNAKLADALAGYLDGSKSLEETVSQVESGLRMYLAE